MSEVAGRLLERERELESISAALAMAREGSGRLLAVEAGPGMGKTTLLEACAELAASREMIVLRASGGEHERALAFGGVLQLFEPIVRRVQPGQRAALLSGSAALAGELFDAPGSRRRLPEERQALSIIHGLFWLTVNLCQPDAGSGEVTSRPLVLLVDDAHLLDAASVAFVVYLSRRVDELPVLVIVASRPSDPGSARELETLKTSAAIVVRPAGLSGHAVQKLLADELGSKVVAPAFAQECMRITGGNPFLVHELLRELRGEGIAPETDAVARLERLVPDAVLQAVVARLARLGSAPGAIAKVVAVLGRDASLRFASELAGIGLDAAIEATDALTAAGIFAPGEPLRFTHGLIGSAIESDLPAAWRASIELRAAKLLAAAGEPNERVSMHLLDSAPSGDPWVVEMLARSAEEARARGAPDVAADHLRRAVAEPPRRAARAGLLSALAEAEAAAGQPGALAHLDQALELIDDRPLRASLLGTLGRVLWARGRHREADGAFQRAIAELDDPRAPLARELKARRAIAAHQAGTAPMQSLDAVLDEFASTPPGSELPVERAALAITAARWAVTGAPRDQFLPLITRAVQEPTLADQVSDDAGMVLTIAAVTLLHADKLDLSFKLLDAALDRARADGSVLALATVNYLRAWPLYFTGAVLHAIADAELALSGRRYGWHMHAGAACAILAHARIEHGDLSGAADALKQADTLELPDQAAEHSLLLIARGHLQLATRDPAGALAALQRAGQRDDALGISGRPIAWRILAAQAALALQDREHAIALADAELARAECTEVPRTIGMALRVSGLVKGGEPAIALLQHAVSVLAHSPAQLEHARSLVDLGSLLRRAGERANSREPLRQGLDLADRFAAVPLAERAREELRVAGARPRRKALTGIDSLTASERRVAELAADGLTNREMAQALFVTPKAIEYHMRHVFQKLDITARTQLPTALDGTTADIGAATTASFRLTKTTGPVPGREL